MGNVFLAVVQRKSVIGNATSAKTAARRNMPPFQIIVITMASIAIRKGHPSCAVLSVRIKGASDSGQPLIARNKVRSIPGMPNGEPTAPHT